MSEGPDSVRLWFLLLAWGGDMGLGHLGVGFLGGSIESNRGGVNGLYLGVLLSFVVWELTE